MKLNQLLKQVDSRYTISYEWAGYSVPHYIVRFCDKQWIGSAPTIEQAAQIAIDHNIERLLAL